MSESTALATRSEPKAQLVTGGEVAAIIPRSVEEIFRVAGAMHASGLAPATLNSPEKITVAIMAGAELGLPPFQALQSFAVINGRPSLWGDGLMAVVRSHGFSVKEWLEGDEGAWTARCEVTRPDTGEVITGEFSVDDAKRANLWGKSGPWQQHPKRMLKMRARAFALRDGAADVLRGFQMREEVEDYQPIREVREPAKAGVMARLEASGHHAENGFQEGHVERETTRPLPPEEVDAVIEQAVEADFTPDSYDDDTFPADRPSTTREAPDEETQSGAGGDQPAHDLAGTDVDILDWAASFTRGLAELMTGAEVEAAFKKAKAGGYVLKLKAKSEDMARQLVAAVNVRFGELGAG